MDSIWRLVFDIRYIIQLHTSSPVALSKRALALLQDDCHW